MHRPTRMMIFAAATITAAALASCGEHDENGVDREEDIVSRRGIDNGFTEFATDDDDEGTRTTLTCEIDDKGEEVVTTCKFYWTWPDILWADNPESEDSSDKFVRSISSNITGTQPTAKFMIPGDFSKLSKPLECWVYYVGQENVSPDFKRGEQTVTIKKEQTQAKPYDASHIATDGDCGTALARRSSINERFSFKLDHKAAYLLISPYWDEVVTDTLAKLLRVEIESKEGDEGDILAAQFRLTTDGLSSAPVPSSSLTPSASITLYCESNATLTGFKLFNNRDSAMAKTGCYVVMNPTRGNATRTLYIKYHILTRDGYTSFIRRKVPKTTYVANSVTRIRHRLTPLYGNFSETQPVYYMWDAPVSEPYAYGTDNYNQNNTATQSCALMPNANELYWYLINGDPIIQAGDAVVFDAYTGKTATTRGIWIRKKAVILANADGTLQKCTHADHNGDGPTFCSEHGEDGEDLRQRFSANNYGNGKVREFRYYSSDNFLDLTSGDYFFLPALGYYDTGVLKEYKGSCCYWSSTVVGNYILAFTCVGNQPRINWYRISDKTKGLVAGTRPDGTPWFQ